MADIEFPKAGTGFCADVVIGDAIHLSLFATETGLGPGAAIFDLKARKWFAEREWASDIEDAKGRALRMVTEYLKFLGQSTPAVEWRPSGGG